ncbi:hypothetical protein L3X38_012118 [Prunus dulcis]|uniref:Uncharacterized protein n=1 Tax=Prunus dulcis TaxID=3755 RepID=A0AAD4ZG31_PRUDU|nr:hypothetical protein L3X38_012118 [Prunus dulcis]
MVYVAGADMDGKKSFTGSSGAQVFEKIRWVRFGLLHWRQQKGANSRTQIATLTKANYQATSFNVEQVRPKRERA